MTFPVLFKIIFQLEHRSATITTWASILSFTVLMASPYGSLQATDIKVHIKPLNQKDQPYLPDINYHPKNTSQNNTKLINQQELLFRNTDPALNIDIQTLAQYFNQMVGLSASDISKLVRVFPFFYDGQTRALIVEAGSCAHCSQEAASDSCTQTVYRVSQLKVHGDGTIDHPKIVSHEVLLHLHSADVDSQHNLKLLASNLRTSKSFMTPMDNLLTQLFGINWKKTARHNVNKKLTIGDAGKILSHHLNLNPLNFIMPLGPPKGSANEASVYIDLLGHIINFFDARDESGVSPLNQKLDPHQWYNYFDSLKPTHTVKDGLAAFYQDKFELFIAQQTRKSTPYSKSFSPNKLNFIIDKESQTPFGILLTDTDSEEKYEVIHSNTNTSTEPEVFPPTSKKTFHSLFLQQEKIMEFILEQFPNYGNILDKVIKNHEQPTLLIEQMGRGFFILGFYALPKKGNFTLSTPIRRLGLNFMLPQPGFGSYDDDKTLYANSNRTMAEILQTSSLKLIAIDVPIDVFTLPPSDTQKSFNAERSPKIITALLKEVKDNSISIKAPLSSNKVAQVGSRKPLQHRNKLNLTTVQKQISDLGKRILRQNLGAKNERIKFANSIIGHKFVASQYVHDWKRKVQGVGNRNIPSKSKLKDHVGLIVVDTGINPNGTIASLKIRRSSGNPRLDNRALQTIQMAAPFPRLPQVLLDEIDILKIPSVWRFLDN